MSGEVRKADGTSTGEGGRPWSQKRELFLTWLARVLMFAGVLIAVQHLFAHAGYRPIPLSMGFQDLFIGYPTASLVGLAGLFIWGRAPHR